MCGFGCIFNRSSKISKIELEEIASSVSFRGPDDTTVLLTNNEFVEKDDFGINAFFFNRLSIIDLDKRSNQPFYDERYILLFNGEIYNYKELKIKLEGFNINFNTSSDTEVLFRSLIHWGADIISDLNGMFAFVFIDKLDKKVIFSRDRTGIKPLYYGIIDDQIVLGSELDSLTKLVNRKPVINNESIDLYLSYQYIPTPYTIWENYFKLIPGSFVEFNFKEGYDKIVIKPKIYWDSYRIEPINKNIQFDLERLLVKSVGSQLNSDVPVGFLLSSGIDSSLIASIINKHFSDREYIFFTVAFNGIEDTDESNAASIFLSKFKNKNFKHQVLKISSDLIATEAVSFNKYLDEPFADYAVILNYLISKEASKYVKVLISGDGADELFWGYERYNDWKKLSFSCFSLYNFRTSIKPNLVSRIIRKFEFNPINKYENLVTILNTNTNRSKTWWRESLDEIKNKEQIPSMIDMKSYLPDCMNYKVDRSSMAASIEVRVPYLDNFLIDYALSVKLSSKSNSVFNNKAPLKELLCQLAPHYDINTPKRGFSFPLNNWITNYWIDDIINKVNDNYINSLGININLNVNNILNMHIKGEKDNSILIWRLWMLTNWLEEKYN